MEYAGSFTCNKKTEPSCMPRKNKRRPRMLFCLFKYQFKNKKNVEKIFRERYIHQQKMVSIQGNGSEKYSHTLCMEPIFNKYILIELHAHSK